MIRNFAILFKFYVPHDCLQLVCQQVNQGSSSTATSKWSIVGRDGERLNVGDIVKDFRGTPMVIAGIRAPKHSGSTGRISFNAADGVYLGEFYPSVIGAGLVEDTGRPADDAPAPSLKAVNADIAHTGWTLRRSPAGYYYFTHETMQPTSGVYTYRVPGTTYGYWRAALAEKIEELR